MTDNKFFDVSDVDIPPPGDNDPHPIDAPIQTPPRDPDPDQWPNPGPDLPDPDDDPTLPPDTDLPEDMPDPFRAGILPGGIVAFDDDSAFEGDDADASPI
jgi:hypothetical protein